MPRVDVNGLGVAYDSFGEGPPLVLLHGLACGRRMWRKQIAALRARFRVIVYDMRGHGASGAPDDPAQYSAEHLAQDFIGLLDHLGIAKAHVVGFSMGGGPALALALRQPQRVGALVLCGVGSGAENTWASQRLAEIWIGYAREGGMEKMVTEMLRSDFFKGYANRGPSARRHMKALICQHPLHGITHTLAGVVARRKSLFRMTGTLAKVTPPTLVLLGQQDGVCQKSARLLNASIAGSELLRIPAAGHTLPLEAPDAFSEAVAKFVVDRGGAI
jgi:pimeloyl-ACP methyl ester carboxylesterase